MSKFLDLNGLGYFWGKILVRINAVADIVDTKASITLVNTKADITLVNTKADKAHTQLGQYNEADPGNDNLLMIGNGTDENNPNTVFAVDSDGNVNADGSVFANDEVSVLDTGGVTHNLTNKVDKTGDTMTGNLLVDNHRVRTLAGSIERGNPGSSDIYGGSTGFQVCDKDGNQIGYIQPVQYSNGGETMQIGVSSYGGSSTDYNFIELGFDENGDKIYKMAKDKNWTTGLANIAWYMRRGRFVTVAAYGNGNPQKKISSSWTTLFTLPEGYRPQTHEVRGYCTNHGSDAPVCYEINTDGTVRAYSNAANNPYWSIYVTFPVD